VTTELGVELKSAKVIFELKTLFSTKSPVGAGIGSTFNVGANPFLALVSADAEDEVDVPISFVAVTVKV
jgi:hypothetical protein